MLFSDIFKFQVDGESYKILTRPDRYNVKVRRSIQDLEPEIDGTIANLSKASEYGLGALLAKAGYASVR